MPCAKRVRLDNDLIVIVQLHSIAVERYHLVRWRDEDLVPVVPDTNVTRIEGAEADDDCLVKWGKERYSAEIVASGKQTAITIDQNHEYYIRIEDGNANAGSCISS